MFAALRELHLQALQELISVLKLQGKLDECANVHEELLQHFQKLYGPNSSRTLKHQVRSLHSRCLSFERLKPCQIKLGTIFQRCGRLSDAEATLRQTLSALQRCFGSDDAGTLECLSSLAFLLNQQGRLDEAEPMLSSALEGSRRVFGTDHLKTLLVQNNLAALLISRAAIAHSASDFSGASNIYDAAELIMREAFSLQLSSVGESHAITQQTMHNLAALLHARRNDSEEALKFMRRAVSSRTASLGISNALTIASQSSLVNMLLKRGGDGVSEAEDIMRSMCAIHHGNFDEWIKVCATSQGPGGPLGILVDIRLQ
jgi:tetratricopeptide (TPR) repeat protein